MGGPTTDGSAQRLSQAALEQKRRIDAVSGVPKPVEGLCASAADCPSTLFASAGSLSARSRARPVLIATATSCCWAPS